MEGFFSLSGHLDEGGIGKVVMEFPALKLLLDEVTRQVTDRRILLFGSSSLLASYPEEEPDRIGVETTIDADFFLDPDDKPTRDALYAELGEDNAHQTVHGCRRHLRGCQRPVWPAGDLQPDT